VIFTQIKTRQKLAYVRIVDNIGIVSPESATLYSRIPRSRLLLAHLLPGLLCALLLPVSESLEESYGLQLAFLLRGDKPAPPQVQYIAIDQLSASILNQPPGRDPGKPPSINKLADWDRAVFAKLTGRLAQAGASIIVFDINFEKAMSEADKQFAASIGKAGNVVLLEMPEVASTTAWQLTANGRPAELFAQQAAAVAHMHFLDEDASILDYPLFLASQVQKPSLPLVLLYLSNKQKTDGLAHACFSAKETIDTESHRNTPNMEIAKLYQQIQALIADQNKPLANTCLDLLNSPLGQVLQGDLRERYFLNFYGKQGTFKGASLHQLITSEGEELAKKFTDAVVFIGIADQTLHTNVEDDYETIYHPGKVAGVELLATAYANLLVKESLHKLGGVPASLLLVAFSLALGGLTLFTSKYKMVFAILACSAFYLLVAILLLDQHNVWMPLFFPPYIQTPIAIALGWLLRLQETEHLSHTLRGFVSSWLGDRLFRGETVTSKPETLYSICLHSDVVGYSRLAEQLVPDPMQLKTLESEYWQLVDKQIAQHQGIRLEISGDGMTCVWTSTSKHNAPYELACTAVLNLQRTIDHFNLKYPDTPFITRIGLHAGPVALGLIGGSTQYTLAVGGDVANTAARLENDINKLLGTRSLISGAVQVGLDTDTVLTRRLGNFIPRGKSQAIEVYELLDQRDKANTDIEAFQAALDMLQTGERVKARACFASLLARFPQDGPSRFYLRLIDSQTQPLTQIDLNTLNDRAHAQPSLPASAHHG
jgi:adenylate cyclase